MKDEDKTKEQLLKELSELRQKVAEFKRTESERQWAEDALRESEERYRALVDSTEDSIYLVDENYRYLFINKKHLTRIGLSRVRFIGQSFSEIHSPEETEKFSKKVDKVFKTGKSAQYEYKSDKDGRYFLQTFSPVKKPDGKIFAVTVISKDVTERKWVEEALRESEERFRALFNHATDSIFLLKPTEEGLIIVDANYTACTIHGYTYEGLIGKPITFLGDEETRRHLPEKTQRLMDGELLTFDATHVRKDGTTFPVEVSAQLIKIADEPYVLAIDRDISERKQMEEELRALSLTDELTGLLNRRGCLTLAEHLIKIANRQKRGLFLLYADVDNLKGINDNFGHLQGDMALKDVAGILKANYRESDIIARIGGDEFVVVPVGTTGDTEEIIKTRLQKELENYLIKSRRPYNLSISVGIAYYDPESPCSINELMFKGDKLMYEHKKQKKSQL